jgi:CRISPR-associated protein Cpf1
MVEDGKLYLFQIYNKDFSPYSKGTPNMHTLYWKMLFDENNLKNVIYKLNGQAEVFYRKSSLKRNITHPANNEIKNKNKLNQKTTSIFLYDLIKDKRYTMDKFQFHVPITLNFKSRGKENINEEVNNYIKENGIKHIIGIDRGERNLLYLVMVDLKGNIIKQYSLNEIVNRDKNDILHKTDYHSLLDEKEKDRDEARKSWKTIENIKELKEGYLSQVVHQISQMIVKYNAIVVLEDLNGGFKQSRQKVEKQVYQKFETMLIDKLNYFVDKKKAINEDGGLLNAYQLTNKFISFQKMGKQCGFLFYIWAWNTSKIDPVTGFVNLFDTKYENIEKARGFFNKFQKISYNKEKDWFEFSFDYNDFTTKAEDTKTNWTITTQGKRIKTFRNPAKNNEFDNEEFNLTNSFKELFSKYNINFQNLKEDISKQTAKEFYEKLLELFHFILQMRNSVTNTEKDYMISPVANSKGDFYNSEEEREKGKNNDGDWISKLPVDADANGAYNIARKGLWIIKQIKESNNLKPKLAITNKEWLSFAQNKPYLE